MTDVFRYAAFISYSSKDEAFAKRLHQALEQYVIPRSLGSIKLVGATKGNRIYPVFRDRDELSAGALGELLESNLRASAALIVVCSPSGVASPWVEKEVEYFAALGRRNKIYAVISDRVSRDARVAPLLPKALQDHTDLELLAADARDGQDGFRGAWLKIVAALVGIAVGRLTNRDHQRRRIRALQATLALLVALLTLSFLYTHRVVIERELIAIRDFRPYIVTRDEAVALGKFGDCEAIRRDCPMMIVLPAGEVAISTPLLPEGYEVSDLVVSIAAFAVSEDEITVGQWTRCVALGGCSGYRLGGWKARAATEVSWSDAQNYVAWLSQMTGQEYRLLSDAEWLYAAQTTSPQTATNCTSFSSVEDNPDACASSAPEAPPVNMFGLRDMYRGVSEWVDGCYNHWSISELSCELRGHRGGHLDFDSVGREEIEDRRMTHVGFRVARTL